MNPLLPEAVSTTIHQLDFSNTAFLPGATSSDTVQCDSGTITRTLTVDLATGDFSWTWFYDACVISGFYSNGTMDVIGKLDLYTGEVLQINKILLIDLTEAYGTESYTYSGQVEFPLATSADEQLINYMVRNNYSGSVYLYENYRFVVIDCVSDYEITLTGRLYHPDHGYADISTQSTLHLLPDADWPHIGILSASGINSSFEIDCEGVSSVTYTLSVDTNGDGSPEISTTETW